jgi:hypothetical protein
MVDYALDNMGIVQVTGLTVKTEHALADDGMALVPRNGNDRPDPL